MSKLRHLRPTRCSFLRQLRLRPISRPATPRPYTGGARTRWKCRLRRVRAYEYCRFSILRELWSAITASSPGGNAAATPCSTCASPSSSTSPRTTAPTCSAASTTCRATTGACGTAPGACRASRVRHGSPGCSGFKCFTLDPPRQTSRGNR